MKLRFMQPLSELSDDENNKITVKGYPYQKKKDNNKTFTVRNNINGSSLEFKYENISVKEIISKVKRQNNLEGENFNLYMEYNKLNPDDHPLICKNEQNYLIFNENKETKKFIISNGSHLKVPMTISQKHFHEISDMIIGMFNIVDLNNLKFRYLAYDREYPLLRNFDAGSLPDNCEISVNYIYTKSNYATFSYDGKTTKIQLSNIETPIYQLKREIKEKLNKYDMTLKSMSFSFYEAPLDEKRKFTEYKILENSKINIVKSKDTFSITVKTPETVSHVYEVTTSDTSTDIKEMIKSQFCYDGEIQLLDERGRELTKDQQLTPNMKLLLNCQKTEIQSEGTLGTKKHLINEILSIKEANKYLKTKLNNENISIFTFNENDNSFEIVDPNKKLFEIETKLFVHQLFKIKSLYFGKHCINIHSNFNEISECNTIEILKKNIISSKINSPPEYFELSTNKRQIEENKMIYEVFNEDNPIEVKFMLENKNDSNHIIKSKSERPKTKPKQRKMLIEEEEEDDENEGDENDSNNEELPEDFTKASRNISFSYRSKKSKKKITGNSNKEKIDNKKEKDDNSDNDDEEKSESNKEELSSSEEEEEEKITYNIQIGREAVRTITLKKNATINDAKIKIAKEEDDIDPNCVSILFAGKNLKKTTVIENLKLTKDDVLRIYIQNIEEILLQTAKALQVYGDGNVEENYSDYEDDDFDDDDDDEGDENDSNNEELREDEDEKSDKVKEQSASSEDEKKRESKKEKSDNSDEVKRYNKDDENKAIESNDKILGSSDKEKNRNNEFVKGNEQMTIDLSNYEKIAYIGRGSYGKVLKIKDKKTGEIYAAKILFKPTSAINNVEKRNLYRELNIMAKITHPNIVKFIGFSPINFKKKDNPVILTELVPNGSLSDVLENERKGMSPAHWDDTHKLIAIYSIASAMSFLHSHDIIHRDLKPANILMIEVEDKFYPKVADFGLSKMINSPEQNSLNINESSGTMGTPVYMSPEIITDSLYTKACDVYAFGIIVYEIITGQIPFKGFKNPFQVTSKVQSGERPKIQEYTPKVFKEFIESCWNQDPKLRPKFKNIVKDLKENKKFITENVNKDEYFNFIDYIGEQQSKYDETRKISSQYIQQE